MSSSTSSVAAGVDEIWCVSVNDAFVMGAWARDQKTAGKVRMLGDGDAAFTKATGLTLDLTGKGLGLRSNRYSMLVKNGKVASLNIEGLASLVSDAATLLAQAKKAEAAAVRYHLYSYSLMLMRCKGQKDLHNLAFR